MTGRTTYRGRRPQNGSELTRLKVHWEGVPDQLIEAARLGLNRSCVGCYRTPLDGGLRCLDCFRKVARPITSKGGCGTDAGHTAHRRKGETPCGGCTEAHAAAGLVRARRRAEFRHGTEHGAARHRKRGEAPCGECAQAERTASRERRRRSRSAA